ncbi:hypothetical protein WG66_005525 [Moniliophthora roreri]|nr:hypothetical protein WG66_005525 [Moniliophthora roreri]
MSATQISTDGSGLNMSEIFAPFYWGFIISLFFGGITIVQAYIYFPHPTDRKHVQIIIPHYGSLAQLNSVTTELNVECLISTIITFISQMYFVFQIYTIKGLGRVARLLIIAITICAALAFGCVSAMIIFHHGVLANRNETFSVEFHHIFFGLAKGFGTLTDLIATLAMCFFLSSSKTGISVQTNGLIKSLIQFAVNRGIVVTLIQTLLLILFYAAPNNLYWYDTRFSSRSHFIKTHRVWLRLAAHINKYAGSKVVNSSLISNRYISSRLNEDRKFGTPHHDHAAESRDKSFEMPTVTKSLVVADL